MTNLMQNKNAKYRVKNAQGVYEVVHLETNVDQVLETELKQFVSANEKAEWSGKATVDSVTNVQKNVDKVAEDLASEVTRATGVEVELGERIDVLEGLVVGGEGEGLSAAIADIAKNKEDIAKEIKDRKDADVVLEGRIADNEAAIAGLQAKDVVLEGRIAANTTSLQQVQTEVDLVEVRVDTVESKVATNEGNIAKNASDLQTEIARAKGEEVKIRAELSEAIAGVEAKHDELVERVTTAEGKIEKNTAAIAKEVEDRGAAITAINSKISEMDAAYKNADAAMNGRLDALEEATTDLEQIRTDIESNTSAIVKEVQDRTQAVAGVEAKVTAEVARATKAEQDLGVRVDGVEADLQQAIVDVKADSATKANNALNDAKVYTDGKVAEINAATAELEDRVEANEVALGLVDGKISTAKSEAISTVKDYTDAEITKIDTAYKAADTKVLSDAKSHAEVKISEAKALLENSIQNVDTKVDEVDNKVGVLTSRVAVNEEDIANLKDALSHKNSNTIVVDTEAEIATANPNPKVGDMAYVISSKRAYIFKGVAALTVKNVPTGWVVFDEITNELDLVNYLKKSEAEATYRRKDVKIVESDLHQDLAGKLNAKADKTYVDSELAKKTNEAYVDNKVEEVVAPVREKAVANEAAITKEVSDRKAEITRVEGVITTKVQEVNNTLTNALNEKETALKAEDAKLNNRISKLATVVSAEQPVDTEAGHVWLELVQ